MNPDLSKRALDKIEILCGQGCNDVNLLLEKAKNGSHVKELAEFSHLEIEQILDEQDQIMSVYNKRD